MIKCLSLAVMSGLILAFTAPALVPVRVQAATAPCETASACLQVELHLVNAERARRSLPALSLTVQQSSGFASCVGSYGHSVAMAVTGTIWHKQPGHTRASFPNDICVRYSRVGENVGQARTGDELQDLRALQQMMLSEPHDRGTCATTINHACTMLNPQFRHVGIGIVYAKGATWLTVDFTD